MIPPMHYMFMHNGVAFHPPALNNNAELKNHYQKFKKTLFN